MAPNRAKPCRAWLASLLAVALAGCASTPVFERVRSSEVPNPWSVRAKFYGEEDVAERRLRRVVEDHMLDLSKNPDRVSVAVDAEYDLEDFYRSLGYPDVEIEHRFERDEEKRELNVVFEIGEGPEVTTELELEGNGAFDDDRLLEFWVRSASGTLGLGAPLFVQSDVESFRTSLEIFYKTQGYLDVRVLPPTIERPHLGTVAKVGIVIVEGREYTLETIDLSDDLRAAIGEEALAKILEREGNRAAARELEDVRRAVIARLRRSGYPDPVIRLAPELVKTEAGQQVRLGVSGEPGRRGRIDDIVIEGNENTAQWFVETHIAFAIGEYYDGSKIDETRRGLYLAGLFRRVDVDHEWIDDERIRIKIGLEEDESKSVDLLGGFGSYERARGMIRFEERNVFGTGRRVSIEGRLSTRGHRGAVTFMSPRVFGTKTRFTLGADIFEREEPSFVDKARGATAALSRELGGGLRGRIGYSFRRRDGAESNLADDLDNYTEGNAFTELRLDRRDSVLYPRSGYLIDAQFDFDDPALGSDIEFTRFRLSATGYVPIYRQLHLALRATTGALWPGEDSDRIPLQERFFNGGESTVRSFREARLGPLDGFGAPVGGEFRNIFTAELRMPLRGLLETAAYVDAGNVGSDVDNFGFSDMRYALGFGVRFQLPIGPVRVDTSFNPERIPGEDEWVIHLSVGYPF